MITGADLRTLRHTRGLTLAELANAMGRSVGWVSQVERDISRIGTEDIERLSSILGVSPVMLSQPAPKAAREEGRIVRADRRRPIGERHEGLVESLISPDLTDSFEIVHSTFAPGQSCKKPLQRATQEIGFMLTGQLDLWFGTEKFTVGVGDSFRIRNEPYRWANPYSEPAIALWVISPPVY
ncbi:helix-turn-helix domain-containing protein [Limimaricola cinnabarinus]|uniref:helix-turn-helix domain-containing protein n=1 Tax=Limimaricola cinnabarinus TaxID=1125964 RepID=UPI002490AAA4|nr:XRE family transcriptional regulator [Limimaricola cinnabarinus]